jgi:hypothetical protein
VFATALTMCDVNPPGKGSDTILSRARLRASCVVAAVAAVAAVPASLADARGGASWIWLDFRSCRNN